MESSVEIELVNEKEDIYQGISFEVSKIIYMHKTGGGNAALCTLLAKYSGKEVEVVLEQRYSGSLNFKKIFDIEVALKDVEPYTSPGRAWLEIRPLNADSC